jgi:serine/threonine protein kinase
MHSLGIIHYDIKPDNIMFSSTLNKLVTIDFNLSDITDIPIGRKLPLPFRGTMNFCCPDMIQNFVLANNPKPVDPYYNDIYCLKESMLYISHQLVDKRIEEINVI